MSTIRPTRDDTWRVTLRVEDPNNPGNMINYGLFDAKDGGEVDSEEKIYHPGGMSPPVSLGGRVNVGNIILRRNYRLVRDHDGAVLNLINAVGKSRAEVSQQPMTIQGAPYGQALVYTGTLKRVTPPTHDSEGTEAAMLEIEVTCDIPPTK